MDGGNITVSSEGKLLTAWMREGKIYTNEAGKEETFIEVGRNPVISSSKIGNTILWNTKSDIMALFPKSLKPVSIGKGSYPTIVVSDNMKVVFWEGAEGKLMAKDLSVQ